jgi:hypothetical protein
MLETIAWVVFLLLSGAFIAFATFIAIIMLSEDK